MRMNMKSINVLIDNLVAKDNDEYIQRLYERSWRGKSITGECKKDTVPEDRMLELLERSTEDERLRYLLLDILDEREMNADSIGDKVFEYCLNYPTPWKETLLVSLAHMPLKKEQLERLNRVMDIPEAFYRLFLLHLRDNDLDIAPFRDFLLENEKHLSSLANFQEHTEGQNINRDKIDLTTRLVREQLEKRVQGSADTLFHYSSSLFTLNLYDDQVSVSQFREFLLENEKYFVDRLAECKKFLRRRDLCREKIDTADRLTGERQHRS